METKFSPKLNAYDQLAYIVVGGLLLSLAYLYAHFLQLRLPPISLGTSPVLLLLCIFFGHFVQAISSALSDLPLASPIFRTSKNPSEEFCNTVREKVKKDYDLPEASKKEIWNLCYMAALSNDVTGHVSLFNAYYSLYRGFVVVSILSLLFAFGSALVHSFDRFHSIAIVTSIICAVLFSIRARRFWSYLTIKPLQTYLILEKGRTGQMNGIFKLIIFDADHGFCAFAKTPTNETLLIDCGSAADFSPVSYVKDNEMPTEALQRTYPLTKFILSHPHDDHITDIETLTGELPPQILLRHRYDWNEVKANPRGKRYEALDHYAKWQSGYNSKASPVEWGMRIITSPSLTPEEAKKIDEQKFVNNSSIPVILEYNGFKIVLPGDLETAGWQALLAKDEFRAAIANTSVLVASHHGHSSGYCPEIFHATGKPRFAYASLRTGNESVCDAYRSESNVKRVNYNGEARRFFTSRRDGSLIIEVDQNGKATFNFHRFREPKLTANLRSR